MSWPRIPMRLVCCVLSPSSNRQSSKSPDVLMIPMILAAAAPRDSDAGVATVSSVLGGNPRLRIGAVSFMTHRRAIFESLGKADSMDAFNTALTIWASGCADSRA